jgi:voltage-gated potassium channel
VALGLAAATALTVPGLAALVEFALQAVLWAGLTFMAVMFGRTVLAWAREARTPATIARMVLTAMAVVPVPTALALGIAPRSAWLWSSVWLLTLRPFSSGLALLGRVARLEAKPLSGVFALFVGVLFFSATLLHLLERQAQPETFGTMPQSLWWAVVTLTTTGYGDAVPQSAFGRVLAGATMMSGIAVFALWAGILATGFAAETRRQDFLRTWDLIARVPFFREVSPSAIAEIARHLRHWEVPTGTNVVRRGQAGDSMYFIADGEVEVELSPDPIRLGAGAFFGEVALISGAPRGASVSTTAPTTLLILDIADFRELTARIPELAKAIEDEGHRRTNANAGAGRR